MIIGIDAGSKFIKCAEIGYSGEIKQTLYREHSGNPEKTVLDYLKSKNHRDIKKIIFSGLHSEYLAGAFKNGYAVDEISATIDALRYYNLTFKYVINVGAASIKFIELDGEGNFYSYRENSLCAAGTGSFLDEQMRRMDFNYNTLSELPFIPDAPDIATRCAVFAKSDMIHRQQEGYTKEEMWSGLCRGVVATMLQTAFKGDIPCEDTLFCGGLFLNPVVRIWLKELVEKSFFLDYGHFLPAIGSAILEDSQATKSPANIADNREHKKIHILSPPGAGSLDFSVQREYFSGGNEIRIHRDLSVGEEISIGIDIGSTSTKLVVIDARSKEVIADIYRKTGGNPIQATGILFAELKKIFKGKFFIIKSTATTGSGRRLIGKIIGADLIVNEITAHYKGATFFDNSVETVFEIGGQDSKYIRGYRGAVVDCNMNYVCAAGTGSFIEEQATRLGYDVREIGEIVLGLNSPHTSDRCTVFMEQDINKLLRDGFTKEEALAGVIRSICKNYLNRVVGNRPITGKKIFFQGATARNRGLVSAFESILGREIIVSPHCHVMGAFGSALLSIDRASTGDKGFKGLDIFERKIELRYDTCRKCSNNCKITIASMGDGTEVMWGFLCGKETFEEAKLRKQENHFNAVTSLIKGKPIDTAAIPDKKSIRIGIPESLTMFSYLPLWKTFLNELGIDTVISGKSTRKIKEKAVNISRSDFCFPIKMGLAHIDELAEKEDIHAIFFPSIISEKEKEKGMPRMFCPYVIAFPSVAKNAFSNSRGTEIISPTIDFRSGERIIIDELHSAMGRFGFNRNDIKESYKKALKEYHSYQLSRFNYGSVVLEKLKEENRTGIVIIGRPYNLYDNIINLGLNERITGQNIETFPYECLLDPHEAEHNIPHMYWNYGKRILHASRIIRDTDNLYPVYFTNFSCGPDSFILSRFEEIMQGKPYLIIELDEHGSETGYLTRIEAFMDVINEKSKRKDTEKMSARLFSMKWKKKERKLWFPGMFEYTPRLFAASFRAWGFDSEALPLEDNEAFELGKQNIRGSECLPACTTIGAFLKKMKETGADPARHALFMPTAQGPCRFGQYSVLHRSILDKNGYGQAEIFSPTSTNSYLGMTGALRRYLLDAMMCGDTIAKCVYRTRPYEKNPGETDSVMLDILPDLERIIEKKGGLVAATARAVERLSKIPVFNESRPLAGIVGEIYVRSNPFCNNQVIRYIESMGGEAWLAPMSEWVIYTAWMERYLAGYYRKNLFNKIVINEKTGYMMKRIHEFEHAMKECMTGREEPDIERVINRGKQYVPLEFEGEVILTIGRTIVFLEDGADMVVNCAPFGCMPGNITTTIFQNIQREFKKPVINLFYDGECDVNRIIGVYLNNVSREAREAMQEVV